MESTLEEQIFAHIKAQLDKQNRDLSWYIDNYFTKEEAIRHSDNLHNMMVKKEGLFAYIELIKMANGVKSTSNFIK